MRCHCQQQHTTRNQATPSACRLPFSLAPAPICRRAIAVLCPRWPSAAYAVVVLDKWCDEMRDALDAMQNLLALLQPGRGGPLGFMEQHVAKHFGEGVLAALRRAPRSWCCGVLWAML